MARAVGETTSLTSTSPYNYPSYSPMAPKRKHRGVSRIPHYSSASSSHGPIAPPPVYEGFAVAAASPAPTAPASTSGARSDVPIVQPYGRGSAGQLLSVGAWFGACDLRVAGQLLSGGASTAGPHGQPACVRVERHFSFARRPCSLGVGF